MYDVQPLNKRRNDFVQSVEIFESISVTMGDVENSEMYKPLRHRDVLAI